MTAKPRKVANYPRYERFDAVRPYEGRHCLVTYRNGSASDFTQTIEAVVLGASNSLTNGNSTGDLVVLPVSLNAGGRFTVSSATGERISVRALTIALANVATIELVSEEEGS